MIASATRRLKRARVYFGHGTDNARDEAVALVLHVMKLPPDAPVRVLTRRVSVAQRARFEALLKRADDALYAAKHAGRNRVIALTSRQESPLKPAPIAVAS